MQSGFARLCLWILLVIGLTSASAAVPLGDAKIVEIGQQIPASGFQSGSITHPLDGWIIAAGPVSSGAFVSDSWSVSNPLTGTGDVGFTQGEITAPSRADSIITTCISPAGKFSDVSFPPSVSVLDGTQQLKRGPFSYTLNSADNTVSVADNSNTAIVSASATGSTVSVGAAPRAIVVSPNGQYVYVLNYGDATVSVIKAPENVVMAISVGSKPSSMALSSDGRKLFVTSEGQNAVYVIDTVTRTVIDIVSFGDTPNRLLVHPDGSRLYILSQASGKLVVMDVATKAVTTVANFAGEHRTAGDMIIDAEGKHIYVTVGDTSRNATLLASVDLSSTAVSYIGIPMPGLPQGLEIQPHQSSLHVISGPIINPGCPSYNNVYAINTAARQLTETFSRDPGTPKKITGPTLTSVIKMDAGPLTFSVPVGQSTEHVVTLSNTGALSMKIDAVLLVAGENGATGDFGVKNDVCSGKTIEAGGQCQFTVTYTSASESSYIGEVIVASDSAASYQPLSLSGQGIRAVATPTSSSDPSSGGGGAFEPLALLLLMGLWWCRSTWVRNELGLIP